MYISREISAAGRHTTSAHTRISGAAVYHLLAQLAHTVWCSRAAIRTTTASLAQLAHAQAAMGQLPQLDRHNRRMHGGRPLPMKVPSRVPAAAYLA